LLEFPLILGNLISRGLVSSDHIDLLLHSFIDPFVRIYIRFKISQKVIFTGGKDLSFHEKNPRKHFQFVSK
jgi:hypothetical protein